MNFFFDENLPRALVKALNVLLEPSKPNYEIHHVVDKFGLGETDVNWMREAGKFHKPIAITSDQKILTRNHERMAIGQNGLTVFVIPSSQRQKNFGKNQYG